MCQRGATAAMDNLGTILETNGVSTVVALRLKVTCEKSNHSTIFGQGPEESERFAAALMAGHFTSLLIPSFPVGDISGLTLCLPASHVGAILGALSENDVSHLRAFSITTEEGLDDCFQSNLYQKLDAVLTDGCCKKLQHLELSNRVLDGVDVCEVLTRATLSGNLESLTSVHLGKNYVVDVSPFHLLDFRGICLDGCWMSSQRVLGFADALMNSTGTQVLLEELELCNGALDGVDGWNVLTRAIKSGKLKNTRSLRLSQNALNQVNLEDLVPLILLDSFVNLVMDGCWISSEQVWGLANALMNGPSTRLALKKLDLRDNLLRNSAVDALLTLAYFDMLPQLQTLNLGMNKGLDLLAFNSLTETLRKGQLCRLQTLSLVGIPVGNVAVEAIVDAYIENEDLTVVFDIDWIQVSDPALKTNVDQYRERNIRLRTLKEEHKDVLEEVVPLTSAKIFLCGFPGVGKTTLRGALTQCPLETPAPTRGIELSQLEERQLTLTLWDLAGQEDYHVLHGTFFADLGLSSGRATIFVLVLRAHFKKAAKVEKDLLYWLRFIATSSRKHVKRHVVIVLNCFDGQQCAMHHMNLWTALIRGNKELFQDLLDIHLVPFSVDVRFPTAVQPLKDYLVGQAQTLLENVTVPKVCFQLQEELKRWHQDDRNSHLPIMTWETFEKLVNLKQKENLLSERQLKAAALYLHEIGGIIYFDQKATTKPGSNNRSVVVVHPEWFCRQVVGELLLPEEMLEDGCTLIQCDSGSIRTDWFEACFQHLLVEGIQSDDVVCMLERVGLCYRKGTKEIMVPALIKEDDGCLKDWDDEGCQLVIGRSLSREDYERTAIPITLFRQLQVELAQDTNFGGREDSEYRAGKYYSSFKVGEFSFLIQVDANSLNPSDDRIDILAKTVDVKSGSLSQVEGVCEIIEKLQVLCFACCPGLRYDIKVIKPWTATQETPEITERQLLSLRKIKVLLLQGQHYSSWRVNGNAVELQTFLSKAEMKALLEINVGMKTGIDEGTDDADFLEEAVEEVERIDYYYNSDSEDSEDPNDSLDGVEGSEITDVLSQGVEEIENADVESYDIGELFAEDSFPIVKEAEEENCSNALSVGKETAFTDLHNKDHQGLTTKFFDARFQEVKDMIFDVRSHLDNAVHSEGNLTRRHVDVGNKKLFLLTEERNNELLLYIQAHYSFSIAEKEKSVPRFLFLKRKDSSGFWTSFKDTVKAPFRKYYRLHFLCESQFTDGNVHWVRDQEGLKLCKNTLVNEWLKDVEPWVRWSYYVVTVLAQIVLTVLVPGTAGAIPSISTCTEEHNRARDTAVKLLQDRDEKIYHRNVGPAKELTDGKERIAEGDGKVLTSDHLTDVNMKLIAKAVINDLIRDLGMSTFLRGTRLRRVLLKATPQHDVGCSQQTGSVLWICVDCLHEYGEERATDITPST
ncbi:unnamed protein product [Calypogeia fissa]